MKIILSTYLLLCLCLPGVLSASESRHQFLYDGGGQQEFTLENTLTETRYRERQVPDTCYRDIPYTERVCQMETRYRNQCQTVPGHEECHMQNETQCRDVVRYREECLPGPSRRVCTANPPRRECQPGPIQRVCERTPDREECHNGPAHQECHTDPARQECTTSPSHQVCSNTPARRVCSPEREVRKCETVNKPVCTIENGRRICRNQSTQVCRMVKVPGECRDVPGERVCQTVPGQRTCHSVPGQRICTNVPGQRICNRIPGQQVCRNVPGPQICRDIVIAPTCRNIPGEPICRRVAYNDRECTQVPRRVCQWVPDQNVCSQVPYQEEVCRDVTRIRKEPYACTRTVNEPYEVPVREFRAKVSTTFSSQAPLAPVMFEFELSKEGEITVSARPRNSEDLILMTRTIEGTTNGIQTDISANYQVDFNRMEILNAVQSPIEKLKLKKRELRFVTKKVLRPDLLRLKIRLEDHGKVILDKVLGVNELEIKNQDLNSLITVNLEKAGLKLSWLKKYHVFLDLRVEFPGRVVNLPAPRLKQVLEVDKRRW